jgi:hypothetical protein
MRRTNQKLSHLGAAIAAGQMRSKACGRLVEGLVMRQDPKPNRNPVPDWSSLPNLTKLPNWSNLSLKTRMPKKKATLVSRGTRAVLYQREPLKRLGERS